MEKNMSKVLSEFVQNDRRAVVLAAGEGYDVQLWESDSLKRTVNIMGHTEQYADDCAENWVIGVTKQ